MPIPEAASEVRLYETPASLADAVAQVQALKQAGRCATRVGVLDGGPRGASRARLGPDRLGC